VTRIISDKDAAMRADANQLRLALKRCQEWTEGKRKRLSSDDVRRLLTALVRINRGAQLHMAAVGAWATWHQNKSTIVNANGIRPDGGNEEKDWAAVLWCMRAIEDWVGTPAEDIPAPSTNEAETQEAS